MLKRFLVVLLLLLTTAQGALAIGRVDTEGATVDNKFTEGNPVLAQPSTVLGADWLNDVQEELVGVVEDSGQTPVKGDQSQLRKALIIRVSTLSELRDINDMAAGRTVQTMGYAAIDDGGGGEFIFNNTDLSAEVAADPQQGIYIAPDSDPTGSSGAWVRNYVPDTVNVNWFGAFGNGSDESIKIQAAISFGKPTYFPDPITYYKFGDINIDTRGQRITGSGMRKCAVVPNGTNLFKVREHNVEISDFWFRPADISAQVQSSNAANIIYVENIAGASKNIDGLRVHDNYFQDIAGAALFIKSGLRESYIRNNQFRGMGSVANDLGVINAAPNADFQDSCNYVYVTQNVFYRAETPFIYLKAVSGSNPVEHYYDNWFFNGNLFHGQLLNEAVAVADPTGPVLAGQTDMIKIQSFTDMMFDNNTFASFHGDYHAIRALALTTDEKNEDIYIRDNRFFVDNNGSYGGTAIAVDDTFVNVITRNTFAAGFQTHDIEVVYSGAFAYTPTVDVATNLSNNQYSVSVSLPSSYLLSDYAVKALTAASVDTQTLTISGNINYKRSGRTTLTSSATSQSVTWAGLGLSNMPNGNYDVYARVLDQNLSVWITGTTTAGFIINLPSNPGTRVVSWFVIDSTGF